MELLAASGEYHAALRQYELCRAALASELDVEPGAEITRLYSALTDQPQCSPRQASRPAAPARTAAAMRSHPATAQPALPAHNLCGPRRGGPGVGHTLTGSGLPPADAGWPRRHRQDRPGPGSRTRIYRARCAPPVGDRSTGSFLRVSFLQTCCRLTRRRASSPPLPRSIGFTFYSDAPPQLQLLGYLHARKLLLLLDNFEQLADAASLLSELVAAAPGLKLLVTSRMALPLQSAELHAVQGLAYPQAGQSAASEPAAQKQRRNG